MDAARRGRQQVSPERRADVTHLAAGRSERSGTRGRLPGLECPRGRSWPQGVVSGVGTLSSPPPERRAAAVADPLRACSSRGPICFGGAAWEQLLPWVPWGIWVLEDFPPRFFWKQELGGGGRGQRARIRPWSGGGGERVRRERQGTSWASDFRVIEAERGWLLDLFFFFPPVVGGLRGGTLKAYF
jgi:hypothetical protein